MEFTVKNLSDTVLLRSYLRDTLGVSRRILTILKSTENGICVNVKHVNVLEKIGNGDIISLKIEDTSTENFSCPPSLLPVPEIISETDVFIAVNKPAGMPTHPSRGHYEDTLANRISGYFLRQNKPFVFRAVNRLDSDTSGIVLIALNKYYSCALSEALKKGLFSKEYLAVTENLPSDSGVIEGYISRESDSIIKRRLTANEIPGSHYSRTEYEVVLRSEKYCLVRLKPITGKTHQLRVHLSSIGYPIIGDTMYGSESRFIGRQALHAVKLTFPSPVSKNFITLSAPIPEDFRNLLTLIGLHTNNKDINI